MARRPSQSINMDAEAEVARSSGSLGEGTQVTLTIRTQLVLLFTIGGIVFAAAAAWYTTKADIADSKAKTEALQSLVTAYLKDSEEKWKQYAIDRELDRSESRKWREELRDAIRSIK